MTGLFDDLIPGDALGESAQTRWARTQLPFAQATADRLGVPVEAVLAQTALETGWGQHAPGGNLFGIKGGSGPALATTEVRDGQAVSEVARFRQYADPAASYADHADLLARRYPQAAAARTVEDYAAGLMAGGYATDPDYAGKIIRIANSPDLRAALGTRTPAAGGLFADLIPTPAATSAAVAPPPAGATSAPLPLDAPAAPAAPPESDPDPGMFADLIPRPLVRCPRRLGCPSGHEHPRHEMAVAEGAIGRIEEWFGRRQRDPRRRADVVVR